MPKVTGPLYSVEAHGDLAKALTFQNRPGGAAVLTFSKPGSRVKKHAVPTAEQELLRYYYAEAVAYWQALTEPHKQEWRDFVK